MATYSKIKGDTALYLPVGTIMPWSKANVPAGFLYCDGSPVSRTLYADLFAVIGTTFGNPNASEFNLPDFQDRSAIGASNNRTFASKNSTALADQTPNITFPDGAGNVQNMTVVSNINVTASANVPIPAHTHYMWSTVDTLNVDAGSTRPNIINTNTQAVRSVGNSQGSTDFKYRITKTNSTANVGRTSTTGSGSGAHSHNISGNIAASFNQSNLNATASAVDIENPYLAIRYMIKF